MKNSAPHPIRAKTLTLAAACIVLGLGSWGCGGGGSPVANSAPSAGFSLSSAALNFSNQGVGTASAPQTVILTNVGDAALSLSKIQVTGPNAGNFSLTNGCGSSLAASAQCTLSVTFAPSAAGTRTASLGFIDNAAGSPQTMSLTGAGVTGVPAANLSPASFAFAGQPVTIPSSAQVFTLSNSGNVALDIADIGFTGLNEGEFSQITSCGATLNANSSCLIAVVFTPAASGTRSASLRVADNSLGTSGSVQSATLSGAGSHDVILSWTPSPGPDVASYCVYRGTAPGGEGLIPLVCQPGTSTIFVDTSVTPGTTYYYMVKATGSDGEQSIASKETQATVPAS